MADVFDVAAFFVQMANLSADDQMTNLKLNKLLYYAQGASLSRTGNTLFNDSIEAWTYGPVVPAIYHKYKVCGKHPIEFSEPVERNRFTDTELEILLDVMREFGQYTGSKLVSLTHRPGSPWAIAQEKDLPCLEPEDLKEFFTKNPVSFFHKQIKIPQVEKLPADWYSPDEDDEWETYL